MTLQTQSQAIVDLATALGALRAEVRQAFEALQPKRGTDANGRALEELKALLELQAATIRRLRAERDEFNGEVDRLQAELALLRAHRERKGLQ